MEFSHNSFPSLHPHPSFPRICGLLGSPVVTESVEVMIMTSCKSVLRIPVFLGPHSYNPRTIDSPLTGILANYSSDNPL